MTADLSAVPGVRAHRSGPSSVVLERDGARACLSLREASLHLVQITAQDAVRGTRAASRLLDDVLAVADLHAIAATLLVAPTGGLSASDLRAWYARRGFLADGRASMVRPAPLLLAA